MPQIASGPDHLGVSTRRVEKLVETLGITQLSKSQVSVMAKSLDASTARLRAMKQKIGPVASGSPGLAAAGAVSVGGRR